MKLFKAICQVTCVVALSADASNADENGHSPRATELPPAMTAVPNPGAPQSLAGLRQGVNDALSFASSRAKKFPPLLIKASGTAYLKDFDGSELMVVPSSLLANKNLSSVRLRFHTQGGTDATCYYRPAENTSYSFDFCTRTSDESSCKNNASTCRSSKNLGIAAGDTVLAHGFEIPLGDCNSASCSEEAVEVTISDSNSACEGLAKSSLHFLEDLNCLSSNRIALEVLGANSIVHGHDRAINSHSSEIGLLISGDNTTVNHLSINHINGYGLIAYNTNELRLESNQFRQNLAGVNVYTDKDNTAGVTVIGNDISGSAFSALIFSGNGKQTKDPTIENNKFTNAGSYAIAIDASSAAISGSQNNDFTGSAGALYLSNGNFSISNLDLSQSGATGPQIYVDSAQSITITDSNLSFSSIPNPTDHREALHLYKVGSASVSRLTVSNADVGLKATTDNGTGTVLLLTDSKMTNAGVAAVMVESNDSTSFGKATITNNDLKGAPTGHAIWQVGRTALGSGSVISDNAL